MRTALALSVGLHNIDLVGNILRPLGGCVWRVVLILNPLAKKKNQLLDDHKCSIKLYDEERK